MKKLLAILALSLFIFSACETADEPVPANIDVPDIELVADPTDEDHEEDTDGN